MIEFIKNAVSRQSTLGLKKNLTEHRIMKSGWKGSLWVGTRYDGYRLQTTGSAATFLDKEIERLQGNPTGENEKGYKYWYVDDYRIVEEIISIFGRI
jgi:hypothetical protein